LSQAGVTEWKHGFLNLADITITKYNIVSLVVLMHFFLLVVLFAREVFRESFTHPVEDQKPIFLLFYRTFWWGLGYRSG
jgi:hypothetical protein